MWIKASGDLTENVIQLTTAVSTHLCIIGEEVAIVDASIWALREELWTKIVESLETIEYVLLTHAHFDHVGALPYFKEKCPHLKVVSGKKTAELLGDKKYTASLYEENKNACDAMSQKMEISEKDFHKCLQVDIELTDGDDLNLGAGVEVKLIQTPGHSSDSVSYYVSPDLALASGESLGQFAGRDVVCPSFSDNIKQALSSFQKLQALDIQLLSLPHSGVLSGDLVSSFLNAVPEQLQRLITKVQERISEGELIEEIAASVAAEWLEEGKFPEGPFQHMHKNSVEKIVRAARDYKEPEEPEKEEAEGVPA